MSEHLTKFVLSDCYGNYIEFEDFSDPGAPYVSIEIGSGRGYITNKELDAEQVRRLRDWLSAVIEGVTGREDENGKS